MLRNPQKRANIKALVNRFHLIEDQATLAVEKDRDIGVDDEIHINTFRWQEPK